MSESIDNQKDVRARDFYRERLVPLVNLLDERGVEMFPVAPDPAAETYYRERNDSGSYLHQFDNLETGLRAMWSDIPELANLSGEIVELANALKDSEVKDEISPFIYAMF